MGELHKLPPASRMVGETYPEVHPKRGKESQGYKARRASDAVVGASAERRSDQGQGQGHSEPAP